MVEARPRRRARRMLIVLVSTLLALGLALAAAEAVVRAFDPLGVSYFRNLVKYKREALRRSAVPGLCFEHVPGVRTDVGVPLRINSLGMRGGEIAAEKPVGSRRVLVIGDSIAFGWGVREEETLEAVLERELDERGASRVAVLNGGVVMYNTIQEQILFDERYAALAPDAVVLVFCSNDYLAAHESSLSGEAASEMPADLAGLVSPLDWWLVTNRFEFAVCDLLRHVTVQRLLREMGERGDDERARRRREVMRTYVQSHASDLRKEENLAALAAIAARCEALKIPLVTVPWNAPPEVRALCAKTGAHYVEEVDAVASDPKFRLSVVDAHPNAEGHRLVARALLTTLERIGFVPSR